MSSSGTAFCSCIYETYYTDPWTDPTILQTGPPTINSGGIGVYPTGGSGEIYTVEPGTSGQLAIYGTYLTAGGQDLSPTVTATNGISITGLTYIQDGQLNVSYNAASATPGTAYVTVQTNVGQTSPPQGSIAVGDMTPVITSISQTSFYVNNAASFTISGKHFGSKCAVAFPFPTSGQTISCSDSSISVTNMTPTGAGSGVVTVTAEGYGGQAYDGDQGQPPQSPSSPPVTATDPPAAITAILPPQGMVGYQQPITIAGSNLGTAAPTITATGNVTVTNISKPSGNNGTGVTATLSIPVSSAGGNVTVTVTPTTGNTAPATITFFVQIPTTLIRATYSPGAPGGYGPLVTPVNQPIVNAAGQTVDGVTNACGVYRNLAYSVLDQENPAKVIQGPLDVTITESFSNFSGSGSAPGPLEESVDLINSPSADVIDISALFVRYPTCLSNNQNQSVTQGFTLTYQSKTFPLALINTISRGNFNGTLKDDVNISHN